MSAKNKWNGDAAYKFAMDGAWEGMLRATVYLWNQLQNVVGVSNPRPYTPTPKGQPPRVRTGFGRKNIIYEADRATMTTRVGVLRNAIYLAYQEISPRLNHPWLFKTAEALLPQLRTLAAGGKK